MEPQSVETPKGPVGVILFLVLFALPGLGLLGLSLYQFGKVLQATTWQPIPATVDSSKIVWHDEGDASTLEVAYRYSVDNKSYIGHSASFNVRKTSVEHYSALKSKLDSASVVQIYFNRNDPTESVVVRSVTNYMVGVSIFCICWNVLMLNFILPVILKRKVKHMLVITGIVWILGFGKILSGIGDIKIADGLTVLEKKVFEIPE